MLQEISFKALPAALVEKVEVDVGPSEKSGTQFVLLIFQLPKTKMLTSKMIRKLLY